MNPTVDQRAWDHDSNSDLWISTTLDWLTQKHRESDQPSFENEFAASRLTAPSEAVWPLSLADQLIDFLNNNQQQITQFIKTDADTLNAEDKHDDSLGSRSQNTTASFVKRLDLLCTNLANWLNQFVAQSNDDERISSELIVSDLSGRLYAAIYNFRLSESEGYLLQCLSRSNHDSALGLFAELLTQMPPHDWSATALAVSPLMQRNDWPVAQVLPRLMPGLEHPTTVSTILDLSNYVCRSGLTQPHVAANRAKQLCTLLSGVTERLILFEENPSKFGQSVEQVQKVLSESVALSVALCDALALMGESAAMPDLQKTLDLKHRRVQTEAAGALAKLGEESGKSRLIELASEPTARLRAVQYAEELGFVDEIAPELRSAEAIGASQLALWLTQPQQMGIPPASIECIDSRMQFWPSYEQPQQCFLYRFTYQFPGGDLSNIGIAGPLVMAMAPDLGNLPIDDIYAVYAGWQADHPDIYEVARSEFNEPQLRESERLCEQLIDEGHEIIHILQLGFFVGEVAVVAETQKDESTGYAVSDGLESLWIPTNDRDRPLSADEVYCLYKGRKMLRSFNVSE